MGAYEKTIIDIPSKKYIVRAIYKGVSAGQSILIKSITQMLILYIAETHIKASYKSVVLFYTIAERISK